MFARLVPSKPLFVVSVLFCLLSFRTWRCSCLQGPCCFCHPPRHRLCAVVELLSLLWRVDLFSQRSDLCLMCLRKEGALVCNVATLYLFVLAHCLFTLYLHHSYNRFSTSFPCSWSHMYQTCPYLLILILNKERIFHFYRFTS